MSFIFAMGDPKILINILALTTCICAVFMLVNWIVNKNMPGTKYWFGFVSVMAIGSIFHTLHASSSIWNVLVPNYLYLLGLLLLVKGVDEFFSVHSVYWSWGIVSALHIPGFVYFTLHEPNFMARVLLNYLIWALSMVLCLRAMWYGKNILSARFNAVHWTFTLCCIAFLMVFTFRVMMLGHYSREDTVITNIWINQVFSLAVIVMPLVLCFSLCLLCSSRREKELSDLQSLAETASIQKERYLTMLSHELRTPLNAIVGHAEMLKGVPREPKKHAQLCDVIISAATSLTDMANQVLLQAKKGHNSANRLERCNLFALFNECKTLLDPLAEKKSLTYSLNIKGLKQTQDYLFDKESLSLVIKNLLANAIKYTESGMVELVVECTPINAQQHKVKVSVVDSGRGLSASAIAKIFDPFVTVSSQTIEQGAGMGLTLCQQLLENHSIQLQVESKEGHGSCFFFEFYPATVDVKDSKISQGIETVPKRDHHVLVVEDNPLNIEVMKHYLEQLGMRYQIAKTLGHAEQALQDTQFDLVLLDMHLPDGHALTWFRGKYQHLSVMGKPVFVAVTGDAEAADICEYQSVGIEHTVPKPIQFELLEATFNSLFGTTSIQQKRLIDETRWQRHREAQSLTSQTNLMYLNDHLDYELAQLRGLADIGAMEAVFEKLSELSEEVDSLGMSAFSELLKNTRQELTQGLHADWQKLHLCARDSAYLLKELNTKELN